MDSGLYGTIYLARQGVERADEGNVPGKQSGHFINYIGFLIMNAQDAVLSA